MTLDDIPADMVTVMTDVIDRAFKLAGCDPTCHCCHVVIAIGDTFILARYNKQRFTTTLAERKEQDIMLCSKCDVDDMATMERKALRRHNKWLRENPRAGYTRIHREA